MGLDNGAYVPQEMTLPYTDVNKGMAFFEKAIACTTTFAKKSFTEIMNTIKIENEGATNAVKYSFDGTNVAGEVAASSTATLSDIGKKAIWLGAVAATTTAALTAWAD